MSENTIIRTEIDATLRAAATDILEPMGLTLSDAFRLLTARIAFDKALPFDAFVPNEGTIQAMEEARRGDVKSFDTLDGLLADLHADD